MIIGTPLATRSLYRFVLYIIGIVRYKERKKNHFSTLLYTDRVTSKGHTVNKNHKGHGSVL